MGHTYTIRVIFSETYWYQAGQRVMYMQVDGVTYFQGIDLYALTGARMLVHAKEVQVVAAASTMLLAIGASKNYPLIVGLKVRCLQRCS
jgi:hypothetical protein